MAKSTTQFICQSCGSVTSKWLGKCPDCGEWNTLIEERIQPESKRPGQQSLKQSPTGELRAAPIHSVEIKEGERFNTRFSEFNRVMGGGIMRGSLSLIGGDPGIGKSTLMLQVAGGLENQKSKVLYISAEESVHQIRGRAERLGLSKADILLLAETNLNEIINQIKLIQPELVILDSIQTVYIPELNSAPGSVSQVRECTAMMMHVAKSLHITSFITGHVTKDGSIAGPRVLEHLVDTVLQFEGDRNHQFRLLRTLKNRFGSANEIGVFDMTADGLEEITNPSELFLSRQQSSIPGTVTSVTMEGTRPILIELQALVTPCNYGFPQRNTNGFDQRRMTMLIAVLEKRLRQPIGTQDVFLNVASGMKIEDTGADLAVCMAILSSFNDWAIAKDAVFIGEIGLGGEVRSLSGMEQRLNECAKLGFKKAVIPQFQKGKLKPPAGLKVYTVESLSQAVNLIDELLAPIF